MYYLYGIGAFNEVAFVSMLRAGMDTGVYGAVAAFGASFLFARIIEGSLVGIPTSAARSRPASGWAYRRCCWGRHRVPGRQLCRFAGHRPRHRPGDRLRDHPARKFTINQSNSTYGADVMMGAGNSSGRFLGPLIILSAMTASIPIGIGSLLGALLFYIWGKPITGGAILGAMIPGRSSR